MLPANIPDREGAKRLLTRANLKFPLLSLLWADQAYRGPQFTDWVRQELGWTLVITNQPRNFAWLKAGEPAPKPAPIVIQPRRWVVERTFAWEGRNRRLAKDYEGLSETEEALCYLGMVHLMLKRLTR